MSYYYLSGAPSEVLVISRLASLLQWVFGQEWACKARRSLRRVVFAVVTVTQSPCLRNLLRQLGKENINEDGLICLLNYTLPQRLLIGAVARAKRSTMGNNIWLTIHLRKFGYDVAYARPPAHPPVHTLHVSRFQMSYNLTNS